MNVWETQKGYDAISAIESSLMDIKGSFECFVNVMEEANRLKYEELALKERELKLKELELMNKGVKVKTALEALDERSDR